MSIDDIRIKLKKVKRNQTIGIAVIFFIIAAIIGYIVLVAAGGQNGLNVTLHYNIKYANGVATVENKDSFDWTHIWCRLDTDSNPETYEYMYEIREINSHTSMDIDLTEFTSSDGTSTYDLSKGQPGGLLLWVKCLEGEGRILHRFR